MIKYKLSFKLLQSRGQEGKRHIFTHPQYLHVNCQVSQVLKRELRVDLTYRFVNRKY